MTRRKQPKALKFSDAQWRSIIAAHISLWTRVADRLVQQPPAKRWDALECWLVDEGAACSVWPVRLNAPFHVPAVPDEQGPQHVEQDVDHGTALECNEFHAASEAVDELGDDDEDAFEHWLSFLLDLRVRALRESMTTPAVATALRKLEVDGAVRVLWSQQNDSGRFVHLHHLQGPPIPGATPPSTTLSALAPLYWHSHSYVGRRHSGLRFEGDVLVEATLSGAAVTDETLAWLTPERAACCGSLRTLAFDSTRVTDAAIERVRTLLPHVSVRKR